MAVFIGTLGLLRHPMSSPSFQGKLVYPRAELYGHPGP